MTRADTLTKSCYLKTGFQNKSNIQKLKRIYKIKRQEKKKTGFIACYH